MQKRIHILNGDALKGNFPAAVGGELIVLRECLVEGDATGNNLNEIFESRKRFFARVYNISPMEYAEKSQCEIEKILGIPDNTEVSLWFEDDLFCQVNLWFTAYILSQTGKKYNVSLVRPHTSLELGFGGSDGEGLFSAFKNKRALLEAELSLLGELWTFFQQNDLRGMQVRAKANVDLADFLLPAIEAHARRLPEQGLGEPHRIIADLIDKYGSKHFGTIFRAFIAKDPIYGFGDMQVKTIFDELTQNDN